MAVGRGTKRRRDLGIAAGVVSRDLLKVAHGGLYRAPSLHGWELHDWPTSITPHLLCFSRKPRDHQQEIAG